jgi:soluble lytic murein transglycosylase-like protein
VNQTRRTRRPAPRRRRARKRDWTPHRRIAVWALGISLAVAVVPPLRSGFGTARNALYVAIEASRAPEANRMAAVRYALRYGISYDLAADVWAIAREEGVDPDLAFRLVRVESRFYERAVSPAGALGLAQLMPATAAEMQPGITREQIFDRKTNLRLGFRYLRWLLDVYDGDVAEALHAYNRGPGTVARIRAAGGDPANGYADLVLGRKGTDAYRGSGFWRPTQP